MTDHVATNYPAVDSQRSTGDVFLAFIVTIGPHNNLKSNFHYWRIRD